eukprot:762523-Hanusia_phi.AAC.3
MKHFFTTLSKRKMRVRVSADLKKMLFYRFKRGTIVIFAIGLVGLMSIIVQHYGIIPLIRMIDSKKGLMSLKNNNDPMQNPAHVQKNYTCAGFALKRDTDIAGGDLTSMKTQSLEECCSICSNHTSCTTWSFVHSDSYCWIKSSVFTPSFKVNVTSGLKVQDSGIGGLEEFEKEIHRLKEANKEANAVSSTGLSPASPDPVHCRSIAAAMYANLMNAMMMFLSDSFLTSGFDFSSGAAERVLTLRDFARSAFPIGNGRLGALLHFDPWKDRMELSFDTVASPTQRGSVELVPGLEWKPL